jgi:hypothetical protein
LGAYGLVEALKTGHAAVRIWKVAETGAVEVVERRASVAYRLSLGDWSISYDDDLFAQLASLRDSRLPHETGGVLLGIADVSRKSIHVAHALPELEDSRGSAEGSSAASSGLELRSTAQLKPPCISLVTLASGIRIHACRRPCRAESISRRLSGWATSSNMKDCPVSWRSPGTTGPSRSFWPSQSAEQGSVSRLEVG